MMSRKLIGAVIGVAALLGGLLAAAPASNADTLWHLYNSDTSTDVAVNDVLAGYGELDFYTEFDGNPTYIECHVAETNELFTHTGHVQ